MNVLIVWPVSVLHPALDMRPEAVLALVADAYPQHLTWRTERRNGRNEIAFQMELFGEIAYCLPAIERRLREAGIDPEIRIKVYDHDECSLAQWAWAQQAKSIHRRQLIEEAMSDLRDGPPDPMKAEIRVTLRDRLCKPIEEVKERLLDEVRSRREPVIR